MSAPLFGRKWQVQVYDLTGTTVILDAESLPYGPEESLQITFEVEQPGYTAFWYGDIVLHNLDWDTVGVLVEGMPVVLSAGYEDPSRYGRIFKGRIFQVLLDRDNNVDFRTTLHCLIGKLEIAENFIAGSVDAQLTQQTALVKWMAQNAVRPLPLAYLDPGLSGNTQPRGMTFFGSPRKYIDQAASSIAGQSFLGSDGLSIGRITDGPATTSAQVIRPDTGLIGIPQQIQYGVKFKTLLDPRIVVKLPPYQVKLELTTVAQMRRQIGVLFSQLDKEGYYNVGMVRHIGDSRGNDWYTEVTAYTPAYGRVGGIGIPETVSP